MKVSLKPDKYDFIEMFMKNKKCTYIFLILSFIFLFEKFNNFKLKLL